ncbi:unnamed protein product, partial [Laminaria digitata]
MQGAESRGRNRDKRDSGGATHLLLAFEIRPLATHPFRDGGGGGGENSDGHERYGLDIT